MTKRSIVFILHITLLGLLIIGCSQKPETMENADNEADAEWIGMDEFHMVMAESFHPYRDSSNLEPARRFAKEMVESANQWIANDLPARVNNAEVKALMNDLKAEAENLANLVDKQSDEEIGASLTRLHDVFHHLQEKWYHKDEK